MPAVGPMPVALNQNSRSMCRSNGWRSEQPSWFLAILPAVLNDFGRSFGMNTAF